MNLDLKQAGVENMDSKKEIILTHYRNSIIWVKSLEHLSDEKWRMPIEENKWTIAEVIGHLIPWDQFISEQRLPYIFSDKILPTSPDPQRVNAQAAEMSRIKTKEEIIQLFLDSRQRLIDLMTNIPEKQWNTDLQIGNKTISLFTYFLGMIEHDEHHFRQITNKL